MSSIRAFAFALVAVCSSPVPADAQTPARIDSTRVALRHLYQGFLDGVRARDTLRYRDLLTPDYSYVGDGGIVIRDRSARLKRDMANPDRYEVFDVERCELSVKGSAAVGPCWYHVRGVSNRRRGDWHGVSMLTFVRTDSGWRIAATRPSVLPVRK